MSPDFIYEITTYELIVSAQKEDFVVMKRNIKKSSQYMVKMRKKLLGKELGKKSETLIMTGIRTHSKMSYKGNQKLTRVQWYVMYMEKNWKICEQMIIISTTRIPFFFFLSIKEGASAVLSLNLKDRERKSLVPFTAVFLVVPYFSGQCPKEKKNNINFCILFFFFFPFHYQTSA